ncbi:MAG TPA: hypothetical protein VJJ20_00735 [Candidatus Paceibacterota bacterium]
MKNEPLARISILPQNPPVHKLVAFSPGRAMIRAGLGKEDNFMTRTWSEETSAGFWTFVFGVVVVAAVAVFV